MDDLAHESRPIHSLSRKRKADQDDHNGPPSPSDPPPTPDAMLIDPQATPRCPADAATPGPSTSPWHIARSTQGMAPSWPHPPSPSCAPSAFNPQRNREGQASPKRLRIEIPCTPPGSPRSRRLRGPSSRHHLGRHRRAGETRDTGIVSATEPGPSRGSLLRTASLPSVSSSSRSVPASPVEPITISPHIPPHQPPINRETLKELDLEAILRNPQLRHDLLFDSGLQFRPTSSRRKRDLADNYWLAIVRELECGCTCTTLDANGRLTERRCACGILSMPIDRPLLAFSQGNMMTVRTPSRIRPLLNELLEVLISIIQPPQPPSTRPPGLLFPPPPQHPQFQQNVAHVALLRQLLDPDLIQQEIDHGLFDPSGVFQAIGDIIRCHCAPMRDAAVDQMVALARSCAPGGSGTKLDAVRAIRLCFEIMELMKLDVANHQLQTLRPYLVRTAAQYEIRTFRETRQNRQTTSLGLTRAWLKSAYRAAAEGSSLHSQRFLRHSRQTRVTIAVVKAVVNLIFDPPAVPSPVSSAPSPSSPSSSAAASTPAPSAVSTPTLSSPPIASSRSHSSSSSSSQFAGYPETFFLDYGRLATLSTDAADFTALYMLLMLYRQLVHSHAHRQSRGGARAQVTNDELLRLKKEIWEIGPSHLGLCYMQNRPRPSSSSSSSRGSSSSSPSKHERGERDREAELKKWRADIGDVVLQVTMRATEPRPLQQNLGGEPPARSAEALRAPDASVLSLANSWAESNLRAGSPLSTLMKKRIRECVEEAVLDIVLSPPSSSPASSEPDEPSENDAQSSSSGLEPLMPEIRHLAERAAKLVSIHTNVYGSLYAHPAFLGLDASESESEPCPSPAPALLSATPAPAPASASMS
ncbi:T-complex protein 11-domain-containing protein [Dichomitus squalens]|uniref:T-complex protein 11-domain-containing protein n=1 Tax=Dichomitus squalens TaxID=114155 RepID=A0A4Q9Q4Y9_9APHY|nr:T-complex protein 11-domain-containing protein [Dichomitus squalens]